MIKRRKVNMSYNKDLKKIMILYPDVDTTSSEDFKRLVNIHNVVESAFGNKLDQKLVIAAYNDSKGAKLENANDYYFHVFKTASKINKLPIDTHKQQGV